MRIAVVSDTISTDFYYPIWYRYYANCFNAENLYVFFPEDLTYPTDQFPIARVIPFRLFSNSDRAEKISATVCELLLTYDIVLRVDTDEFLIVNPILNKSLIEYLTELEFSTLTARGYNLIPETTEAIDLSELILFNQRRFLVPYSALYKTCAVRAPTYWTAGFHFCNRPPYIDELLLIHTKLADIPMQIEIGRRVADITQDEKFVEYHTTLKEIFEQRIAEMLTFDRLPAANNLHRDSYDRSFIETFELLPTINGVYHGTILPPERILLELDPSFEGLF